MSKRLPYNFQPGEETIGNTPLPYIRRVEVISQGTLLSPETQSRLLNYYSGAIAQAYQKMRQNSFNSTSDFYSVRRQINDAVKITYTRSGTDEFVDIEITAIGGPPPKPPKRALPKPEKIEIPRNKKLELEEELKREPIYLTTYFIAVTTGGSDVAVYKFFSIKDKAEKLWASPGVGPLSRLSVIRGLGPIWGCSISTKGTYVSGTIITESGDQYGVVYSASGTAAVSPVRLFQRIDCTSEVGIALGIDYAFPDNTFNDAESIGYSIITLPGGTVTTNTTVGNIIAMAGVSADGSVRWGRATNSCFGSLYTNAFVFEGETLTYLVESGYNQESSAGTASGVFSCDATGRYAAGYTESYDGFGFSNATYGLWDLSDKSFTPVTTNPFTAVSSGQIRGADVASDGTLFYLTASEVNPFIFDPAFSKWVNPVTKKEGVFGLQCTRFTSSVSDDGNIFLLNVWDDVEGLPTDRFVVFDRRTEEYVELSDLCADAVAGLDISSAEVLLAELETRSEQVVEKDEDT